MTHPVLDEEYNQYLIICGFPQTTLEKLEAYKKLVEKSVLEVLKVGDLTISQLMLNKI